MIDITIDMWVSETERRRKTFASAPASEYKIITLGFGFHKKCGIGRIVSDVSWNWAIRMRVFPTRLQVFFYKTCLHLHNFF